MNLTIDNILLLGSILLFMGLLGTRTAKYGIPVLLLFLLTGMLAGSDGFGGIRFDEPETAKFIGSVALSFILFSGGLETRWGDIKPVLWQGISLSTLGVVLTAALLGFFVTWVTGLPLIEGLLIGAIVSSTDAAAVFSILRSKNLALKGNLRPLLEFESGSNDPMAYILVISLLSIITNESISITQLIFSFFRQMIAGALSGYLMGMLMIRIINWIRLEYDGLYSVLLITLMLFTYSFTHYIGGNGFLAVYISAFILGNKNFMHKKSLIKHFDGQAWFMQAIMFITLGLLVFPSQIVPNIGIGLLISFALIFVVRPISIYISLAFAKISNRKKIFLSWVGLRGAVPIIFATFPLTAGIDNAGFIFNVVFFIAITSILLQGTTLHMVGRWLHITLPAEIKRSSVFEKELVAGQRSIMVQATIASECPCINKSMLDLSLNGITVTSIERDGRFITPEGNTIIQKNDRLLILASDQEALGKFYNLFGLEKADQTNGN